MSNPTARFRVTGWSNDRFGLVEGPVIKFEVMNMECACTTCFARLHDVESRMEETQFKWEIAAVQLSTRRALSQMLVVEMTEMPEKVDTFLSNLLGLDIREVSRNKHFGGVPQ